MQLRFPLTALLCASLVSACAADDSPANDGAGDAGPGAGDAQQPSPDAAPPLEPLPEPEPRYHSYAEVEAFVQLIAERNPGHVSLHTYGVSAEGRSLYVVKISDDVGTVDSDDLDEPDILINYSIHGDEIITVEAALKLVYELAENYRSDARIAALVDEREIYIVPVVSPDSFEARSRNVQGVDPNRNFPWDGNPDRESIGVIAAARELYESHSFAGSLDYHAFGELVLLPYGGSFEQPANFAELETVGDLLGAVGDYLVEQISALFGRTVNGGSLDYYHWRSGGNTINIGIELGTSKAPPTSQIPEVTATATEIAFRFIEQF